MRNRTVAVERFMEDETFRNIFSKLSKSLRFGACLENELRDDLVTLFRFKYTIVDCLIDEGYEQ